MKMADFTLCGVQDDLLPSLLQTIKFKSHTKPEEKNMSPLGVHGTFVGVEWDSCIADGACIEACPTQVFQWYRSEHDLPAVEMTNATSAGAGENHDREGRKDYTNKSDLIREHDCIWCMAGVTVCTTQAIKVEEANLEVHEITVAEITS